MTAAIPRRTGKLYVHSAHSQVDSCMRYRSAYTQFVLGRRSFLRRAGGAAAAASAGGALLGVRSALAEGCAGATLSDAVLSRFGSRIVGEVIFPGSAAYPSARLLYNRRFDPHPVAIVRAASEADIQRTVEFARTNGIRLAVRSGGHSYIGASGCDGIILDLSSLAGIAPLGGSWFRIGSGTQLQHVYGGLRCNGGWTLPCGSCNTVGFGGIAQGGGFGYLQREHGLTCDRVRSARLVLADGTLVTAAPDADSDLFWAIRGGGGGSFGVVSGFDVEAVPYRTIRVIVWYWPLAAADEALAHVHAVASSGNLPRHTTAALVFNTSNAALAVPQCVCVQFSTATAAEAEATQQLFVGPGGIPATPGMGTSYDAASPACDPTAVAIREHYRAKSSMVFGPPAQGTGTSIRSWLQSRLLDPRLSTSDYATINFLTIGGTVADVAADATAYRHRAANLEVQYLGYVASTLPDAIPANQAWLRGVYADVAPRLAIGGSGGYVNYADEDLTEAQFPQHYWGANYARLQATKRRVDPSNFFRGQQTVRP
jgi:FAD/FMN-containing dehydrogenase